MFHTHWNSVVVAVCVAMAACCCSDVVERRSSLTRHQMCLLCDWPAGVTWELSSQWGRKSTFCELKACQHCEQRRRGKRDAVMERAWWGFLVPFPDKNSRLWKTKKRSNSEVEITCAALCHNPSFRTLIFDCSHVAKHGSLSFNSPLRHSGQHQAGHL